MRIIPDPLETSRLVTLAYLLEAAYPKDQCTSRFSDVGPNQRFEDFLVSGVNSGRFFHALAERIGSEQGQPPVIYDLAFRALMDSRRQRSGKLVNYGLLEVMLPVVVSRSVFASNGREALAAVPDVLKHTSKEDVRWVAAMRKEVYSRSNKQFKREFLFHEAGTTVHEHYEHHRTVAHEASRLFVIELLEGMPLAAAILDTLEQASGSLAMRVNAGFRLAKEKTALPHGAVADLTAAALYLYLADHPDEAVIA